MTTTTVSIFESWGLWLMTLSKAGAGDEPEHTAADGDRARDQARTLEEVPPLHLTLGHAASIARRSA